MRVICIDDYNWLTGGLLVNLKFGEIYEPSGEAKCLDGVGCYIILPLPPTRCMGGVNSLPLYNKKRFIPLSNIDETELVNEKVLENIGGESE